MKHLPPWLKDVPLPPRPQPREVSPPPAPPVAEGGDDIPEWLQSTEAETGSAEALEPSEPSDKGDITVPEWLRGIQNEFGGAESPSPPPQSSPTTARIRPPVGATDWLRSLGVDEQEGEPADQPPHYEEEPEIRGGRDLEDQEVPDWLRDVSSEELDQDLRELGVDPSQFDSHAITEPSPTSELDALEVEPFHFDISAPPPPASEMGKSVPSLFGSEEEPAHQADELVPSWMQEEKPESQPAPPADQPGMGAPDWLSDIGEEPAPEAKQPAARQPAPPADSGVPDWLSGEGEEGAAPSPDMPPVPDWLSDIGEEPALEAKQPAARQPAPPADSGVPDWLRGEGEEGAAPSPDMPPVPDWLSDIGEEPAPEAKQPAARQPAPPADSGVPDWLSGEGEEGATPPSATEPDLPDWLADTTEEPAAAPSAPESGIPPWLASEDETDRPSHPGSEGLPDWLQGAEDVPPSTAAPEAPPVSTAKTDFGSWFEQEPSAASAAPAPPASTPAAEPPGPGTQPPPPGSSESSEFFGGADLPSWLRPPEPTTTPTDTAESRKISWLVGTAEEEEQPAEAAAAPPLVFHPPVFTRSPARIEASNLLQTIVAVPFPEAAPAPQPSAPSILQKIGLDRILYVVLFLALLAGMFFPAATGPFQDSSLTSDQPGAAHTQELFRVVDTLAEREMVLLAYEWDIQRQGDLAPLEDAVTDHLIARRTHMVLVSTDTQGAMLSFDLRDRLEQAGYLKGGAEYILLGYRPGGEMALRAMAQDFRTVLRSDFAGRDATESGVATSAEGPRLSTIHDFSLIVVIANQPQDVRNWIEQIHRVAPGVPMALLLPSEVTPVVRPYLQQPNIFYLSGKHDAMAYRAWSDETGTQKQQAARESGQYHFAILVFILLIIVGVAVNTATSHLRGKP